MLAFKIWALLWEGEKKEEIVREQRRMKRREYETSLSRHAEEGKRWRKGRKDSRQRKNKSRWYLYPPSEEKREK